MQYREQHRLLITSTWHFLLYVLRKFIIVHTVLNWQAKNLRDGVKQRSRTHICFTFKSCFHLYCFVYLMSAISYYNKVMLIYKIWKIQRRHCTVCRKKNSITRLCGLWYFYRYLIPPWNTKEKHFLCKSFYEWENSIWKKFRVNG